jgi:hypothetical protein
VRPTEGRNIIERPLDEPVLVGLELHRGQVRRRGDHEALVGVHQVAERAEGGGHAVLARDHVLLGAKHVELGALQGERGGDAKLHAIPRSVAVLHAVLQLTLGDDDELLRRHRGVVSAGDGVRERDRRLIAAELGEVDRLVGVLQQR